MGESDQGKAYADRLRAQAAKELQQAEQACEAVVEVAPPFKMSRMALLR
jgi:hypothetical protein